MSSATASRVARRAAERGPSGPERSDESGEGCVERGAVSIVMLGVLVIGLVLSMGAARLGSALVGRARADTAADAAALAAADALALGDGADAARTAAKHAASSNHAELVSCACSGTTAEVVVEVDVPALGALAGPARGHAKAEVRPECVVDLPQC